MKILHIAKYYPPEAGGIEALTKMYYDHLSKKNYKFEMVCFSDKPGKCKSQHKNIRFFKTNFKLFSAPFSFNYFFFLINNLKKYDAVNIFLPNPFAVLILLFFFNKKIFITWGSDIINQKISKIFFNNIQNLFLAKSEKIIVLSERYAKTSKDLSNYLSKTVYIPPFLSEQDVSIKLKSFKKKKRLVTIGRLVNYKNHDLLLDVMMKLDNGYKLYILGGGENFFKLARKIKKNHLQKKVFLMGKVSEKLKNKIMKHSDAFIMSSNTRAESFGIVILEAIKTGLPLIIPNVNGSGMLDMIQEGYNGYIYKNNDTNDCKEKILTLFSDKSKYIQYRYNSINLFNKKFSEKINGYKLDKIFYEK